MKDFHLRFFANDNVIRWPNGGPFDLMVEKNVFSVPDTGGAYVLGTSDGTMLTYPWGSSPIFYVGRSTSLRQRLEQHRKYIEEARDDHDEAPWWQRYQYGAAFGASCAYYSRHGPEHPQNVEADLINLFYWTFGSIPAANSAWPNRIEPKRG